MPNDFPIQIPWKSPLKWIEPTSFVLNGEIVTIESCIPEPNYTNATTNLQLSGAITVGAIGGSIALVETGVVASAGSTVGGTLSVTGSVIGGLSGGAIAGGITVIAAALGMLQQAKINKQKQRVLKKQHDRINRLNEQSYELAQQQNKINQNLQRVLSSNKIIQNEYKISEVEILLHVVKTGETLTSISKRYNVPLQKLIKFNREKQAIRNPNLIYVGDGIYIPDQAPTKAKQVTNSKENFFEKLNSPPFYYNFGGTYLPLQLTPEFQQKLDEAYGFFEQFIEEVKSASKSIPTITLPDTLIPENWWKDGNYFVALICDYRWLVEYHNGIYRRIRTFLPTKINRIKLGANKICNRTHHRPASKR